MAKRTKRAKTSTTVLVVLSLFLLLFISAMIALFWFKGAVPDTLISCVLDTSKLECLALAAIKITKVIRGEKDV